MENLNLSSNNFPCLQNPETIQLQLKKNKENLLFELLFKFLIRS